MQAAYLSGYYYQCHEAVQNDDIYLEKNSSWALLAAKLLSVENVDVVEWVIKKLLQSNEYTPCIDVDSVTAAYLIKKGQVFQLLCLMFFMYCDLSFWFCVVSSI